MSPFNWRQQEEQLVQCLPNFYFDQLGHTPDPVSCRIANYQVVVTIEGALTQPEKLLLAQGYTSLVDAFRDGLDHILRARLNRWIAELLNTEIVEMFVSTDIAQDRMMAIAILSPAPDAGLGDRTESN